MGLTPVSPGGGKDVIVAVDPFTRWVEIGILATLNSMHTAHWFHEQIICRYGVPAAVRTDKGTEYQGMFDTYLRE